MRIFFEALAHITARVTGSGLNIALALITQWTLLLCIYFTVKALVS